MSERKIRRALLATVPPDEIGAQRRAWRIVRTAYAERVPSPWPVRHKRPLAAASVGFALLLAALSPPGRAVIRDVREAVGTEKVVGVKQSKPALFSLPAKGRVLVSAPSGVWVVSADGSRRNVGAYDEATWSPHGLHVGAVKRNQLVALTPGGELRWVLSRRRVRHPRWAPSGFRIAYLSGASLRVVDGDKTGDGRVDTARNVAPAWKPGQEHVLAYVDRSGMVNVIATDSRQTLWTAAGSAAWPMLLEWSADGRRLLAVRRLRGRFALIVFDANGRRLQTLEFPGQPLGAAFAPKGHRVAVIRRVGRRSELLVVDADAVRRQQTVFTGLGRFSDIAWSPTGRWLLLGWPSADQWLFIRSTDVKKIDAFSSVAAQFDPGNTRPGAFPKVEGWCCTR